MDKSQNRIRTIVIYFTAFITGAIILMLEILGTRIVAPYYGTTIFVWSSLIGVTMVGLAIGYFAGGWVADRWPETFMLSLIMLSSAMLIILVRFVSRPALLATDFFGPFFGPLLSAAILFILPMILLGMLAPFYVKLIVSELRSTGMGAGSLYGVSTVGSVIGALASGFVFIPLFGITSLLDILTVALALTALMVAFTGKSKMVRQAHQPKMTAVSIIVSIAIILAIGVINLFPSQGKASSPLARSKLLLDTQSLYSRIRVFEYGNRLRGLLVEGAIQTFYDTEKKEFPSSYLPLFDKARTIRGNAKNALVIGLGGGGLDSMWRGSGIEVTNVEIDPEVQSIAKKFFDFKGNAIIDDGRHFLRHAAKKYDLVYLDAFSGFSLCPHLVTKEAFEDVKACLANDGVFCINAVGRIKQTDGKATAVDDFVPAFYATLKKVFRYVVCKANSTGVSSIVYYASNSPMEIKVDALDFTIPESSIVFTDNKNQVELLVADTIVEWREEMKKTLADIFPL